jgi:hypothetical protein
MAETGLARSRTIMTSRGNASDSRHAGADYLAAAFLPTLPSLVHVVTTMQQKDLARRYDKLPRLSRTLSISKRRRPS